MSKIKGALKSKTIGLAGALAITQPVLESFPEIKGFLGEYYGVSFLILSAIVAYLRFVTTKPLEEK
jgi:hypothetical protein